MVAAAIGLVGFAQSWAHKYVLGNPVGSYTGFDLLGNADAGIYAILLLLALIGGGVVSALCFLRIDVRLMAVLAVFGIIAILCTISIWIGVPTDIVLGSGVKAGTAGLLTEIVAGVLLIAAAAYPFSEKLLRR